MTFNLRATAAVLAAADLVLLALLHVLRTDVDPVTRPTSDYGWPMALAGAAMGLAAIALAVTVRPEVRGTAGQIGVGMLVFFGVAKFVQAFFPVDTAGHVTSAGVVHTTLGNVTFFILPVAAACIAAATKARWSIGLAAALVLVTVLVLSGAGGFGPAERLYLVFGAGWLLVTALTVKSNHPVAA